MGRKPKLSKLSDADEDKLSKLSKKQRSQASYGKPDFQDVEDLRAIFETYDKVTGGKLRRHFEELALERAAIPRLEPIDKAERFKYSFPDLDLEDYIRTYFPTIWTDNEHARWFLRYFPGFRAG